MTDRPKNTIRLWVAAAGIVLAMLMGYVEGWSFAPRTIPPKPKTIYVTETRQSLEAQAVADCRDAVNHLNGSNFNVLQSLGGCIARVEDSFHGRK